MKMEGYAGEFLSEEDIIHIHDKLAAASEDNEDLGFIDETGDLFKGQLTLFMQAFLEKMLIQQ